MEHKKQEQGCTLLLLVSIFKYAEQGATLLLRLLVISQLLCKA